MRTESEAHALDGAAVQSLDRLSRTLASRAPEAADLFRRADARHAGALTPAEAADFLRAVMPGISVQACGLHFRPSTVATKLRWSPHTYLRCSLEHSAMSHNSATVCKTGTCVADTGYQR